MKNIIKLSKIFRKCGGFLPPHLSFHSELLTIPWRLLAGDSERAHSNVMKPRNSIWRTSKAASGEKTPALLDRERSQRGQVWLPEQGTTILMISNSPALQGEAGRVSAAAAVGLVVAQSVEESGGQWDGVAAILIGSDVVGGLPGWHGPTVVVGPPEDSAGMWLQASRLSADRVAVLPDSAQWLANYLTRLRDPNLGTGIVGIVGGSGGAGASTLAALIAAGAGAHGNKVLLVDGDEWGGGLDVALAAEEIPGLRWPDLLNASGAINPEQLAASLPQTAGISLLSWGGAADPGGSYTESRAAAAASEVMRAAREAFELVVVDVGRSPESLAALGVHCDGFVVVVPSRLRSALAAARVVESLPAAPVGFVVRGPMGEGVDAHMVAASVGAPCLGTLPVLKRVAEVLEAGRLQDMARRRKVAELSQNLLSWMAGPGISDTAGLGTGRRKQ